MGDAAFESLQLEDETGASLSFLVPCDCEGQEEHHNHYGNPVTAADEHFNGGSGGSIAPSLCIRVISRESRRSPIRLQV